MTSASMLPGLPNWAILFTWVRPAPFFSPLTPRLMLSVIPAHLLLEVDESQDVDKDKYTKEFKPMGATTNCTVVHYGTTWDESTLLEEVKQTNLELQKKDGIRRHFRFDWQEIAKYNPDYLNNVANGALPSGRKSPLVFDPISPSTYPCWRRFLVSSAALSDCWDPFSSSSSATRQNLCPRLSTWPVRPRLRWRNLKLLFVRGGILLS